LGLNLGAGGGGGRSLSLCAVATPEKNKASAPKRSAGKKCFCKFLTGFISQVLMPPARCLAGHILFTSCRVAA